MFSSRLLSLVFSLSRQSDSLLAAFHLITLATERGRDRERRCHSGTRVPLAFKHGSKPRVERNATCDHEFPLRSYVHQTGMYQCWPDTEFRLGYQPGSSSGYEIPLLLDPGSCWPDTEFRPSYQPGSRSGYEIPHLSDPGSCWPDTEFLLGYQPGSSSGYEIPRLFDPGIFSTQAKT